MDFDISTLFSLNADALSDMFDIFDIYNSEYDISALTNLDMDSLDLSSLDLSFLTNTDLSEMSLSDIIDLSQIDLSANVVQIPQPDTQALMQTVFSSVSAENMAQLAADIMTGYRNYLAENGFEEISDAAYYFEEYINSEEAHEMIGDYMLRQ